MNEHMAARTITYYYPDETAPASLKVFQDQSSQIRGFYFTRDRLGDILKEPKAENYAIYFLIGSSDEEHPNPTIYIGQSKNGAKRVTQHKQKKSFWNHCIMFVSDNNVFDTSAIDYMEYYFIQKVVNAGAYSVENKDWRNKEPIILYSNEPIYNQYIAQIEFLLQVEGVRLALPTKKSAGKYYNLKVKGPLAYAYFQDGLFYLEVGSIIRPVSDKSQLKELPNILLNREKQIQLLLSEKKIAPCEDDGYYKVLYPLSFRSPSMMAAFILGYNANGWRTFDGIEELRDTRVPE